MYLRRPFLESFWFDFSTALPFTWLELVLYIEECTNRSCVVAVCCSVLQCVVAVLSSVSQCVVIDFSNGTPSYMARTRSVH